MTCGHAYTPKCYRCVLMKQLEEARAENARALADHREAQRVMREKHQASQDDRLERTRATLQATIDDVRAQLTKAQSIILQLRAGIQHRPSCQCSTCELIAELGSRASGPAN